MTDQRFFSLLFVVVFYQCESANILLLEELPSPSHHLWFRSVTMELINRNHNVTVVSSELDTLKLNNLHQIHMERVYSTVFNSTLNLIEMGAQPPFLQIIGNIIYATKTCEGFTVSKGWQQLQNYPDNFKFDLVIHDFPASSCLLAFLSKFNYPPLIGMTAFGDVSVVASTIRSALIPSMSTHFLFKEDMTSTFFGRLQNFVLNAVVRLVQKVYIDGAMNAMVDKVVNGSFKLLPVEQLRRRATMALINYNEYVDGVEQLPPNVVGVGGLQIQEPKPLSMDFSNIAINATNGLVLFSLGTNVKSEMLGESTITQILDAFERLPEYTFLWKLDLSNATIRIPHNVHIRKWIPQNDILGHENTKLFITHGGLLSTQEAAYNSVPILGIPIMVDQFMNVDRCVEKGIGSRIHVHSINSNSLCDKLNEMLSNPMYKENIRWLSQRFRDQKERPLDRAVWWIEWALRNPNSAPLNRGENLNYFQIQSIDVIGVLTVVALIILWIGVLLLKKILVSIFIPSQSANKSKID